MSDTTTKAKVTTSDKSFKTGAKTTSGTLPEDGFLVGYEVDVKDDVVKLIVNKHQESKDPVPQVSKDKMANRFGVLSRARNYETSTE